MNLLTTDALHTLGIHKSEAEEAELIEHFQATLHERVGLSVLDVLDPEQSKRLAELTAKGDRNELGEWLQLNVPEYTQLVQAEYDILMGELADNADAL